MEEKPVPEVQESKQEPESNGVFKDLPSHLVELSLTTDGSANGSPNNRRHYVPRDFTDPEFKESRDNLANEKTPFADLDPLNHQGTTATATAGGEGAGEGGSDIDD